MPPAPALEALDGIPEAEWQTTVEDLARVYGWRVYHTRDSRGSEPGFPDLVLVRPPRLIFAELKRERGRVSPTQQSWLQALDAVARTVDALLLETDPGRPDSPVAVRVWRPSDFAAVADELRPEVVH